MSNTDRKATTVRGSVTSLEFNVWEPLMSVQTLGQYIQLIKGTVNPKINK